jgi:SAM-dependent methyltransferase
MPDRKAHWDRLYERTSPHEVSWYQQVPALSLRLIEAAGLGKDEPLVEVGGGASVLVDYLLRAGYQRLAVLDISGHALALTQARLGDAASQVEWFEADVTDFTPPHSFRLWHDRAVFHFLTDPADRRAYVETLHRAVPPGGHVIIAAFAVGGPTRCSGLDIVQYDAARLAAELGPGFRLVEEAGEMHRTPGGKEQKFSYFRYRRES